MSPTMSAQRRSLTSLTPEEVTRLLSDPSPDGRVETARLVTSEYVEGRFSAKETKLAEDIYRVMMNDLSDRVRVALSENLKHSEALPHDIAMKLAQDIEAVSLPMIEFSEVLTDEDLIDIIGTQVEAKQIAVAKRKKLSTKISDVLVETKNEKVVETLVRNPGADIAEPTLQKVIDNHGNRENIQEGLAYRQALPLAVAERLVVIAAERLQEHLVTHHDLSPDVASDVIVQARERTTISLMTSEDKLEDVKRLVKQLHGKKRLTPSIILRSLCMGDITFFEVSLAQLANIPIANARVLIHDAGPLGLKSLYEKASLPKQLYRAFRAGIDVFHQTEYDGGANDRERFMRTMIERILTQVDDINSDDLEYLMAKLAKIGGDAL